MLRAHRERPRGRAAEKRDERAAFHSISSSARPDSGSGTVMPSVLAVLRLMYSSSRRLVSGSARTAECSARRTGPGRGRRARSSPLTFRRFGHTINTDEVFGTHRRRMSSSAPIADMVVRSNRRRPKLRKFASLTSAYAQVAQRTPFDSI